MSILLQFLLRFSSLRTRIIAILKNSFYKDLGISIPLNGNLWADLLENDSFDSFSEIFIKHEYLDYLPKETPISVVDIGANYGFFSLWLQSKNPDKDIHSLLIEASPSCCNSIEKVIEQKSLEKRFSLLKGAIGPSNVQFVNFFERPFMASSSIPSPSENFDKPLLIHRITEEQILESFKYPLDLLKCDIEGGEWGLLNYYPKLLSSTRYLLLEWHSWHSGGGGLPQLMEQLNSLGFRTIKTSPTTPATGREGEVGLLLSENTTFKT